MMRKVSRCHDIELTRNLSMAQAKSLGPHLGFKWMPSECLWDQQSQLGTVLWESPEYPIDLYVEGI